MSKFPLVRDKCETQFALLTDETIVADANETLRRANVIYGVVLNAHGRPIGLTTIGDLARHAQPTELLSAFVQEPVFIVEPDTSLDDLVLFSAQPLFESPDTVGVVVEENGSVLGVIPRRIIRQQAERGPLRGIEELAGVPQIRAKYFVCPKMQHYKKLIVRYDPDDPPTCPDHPHLKLVEEG